jgi:hypothetical protein
MKNIIFIVTLILLSSSIFAASSSGRNGINSSSWSLLYGYSENRNKKGFTPGGQAYKLEFGNRWSTNTEINFFISYISQFDAITYSGTAGKIERTSNNGGMWIGYWIFPAFNLHAGYATQNNTYKVKGSFTSSQVSSIESNYSLKNNPTKGLFAGADFVLLQNTTFQLFTNYEYYHLNHAQAHDWEVMAGIRFYPGESKGTGSSQSFFTKFFEWVFSNGKP